MQFNYTTLAVCKRGLFFFFFRSEGSFRESFHKHFIIGHHSVPPCGATKRTPLRGETSTSKINVKQVTSNHACVSHVGHCSARFVSYTVSKVLFLYTKWRACKNNFLTVPRHWLLVKFTNRPRRA